MVIIKEQETSLMNKSPKYAETLSSPIFQSLHNSPKVSLQPQFVGEIGFTRRNPGFVCRCLCFGHSNTNSNS